MFPGESYTSGQLLSESSKGPDARTSWKRNDIITIIDPEYSAFVNLWRARSNSIDNVSRALPSRFRLIRVNSPSAINLFLPPPPPIPRWSFLRLLGDGGHARTSNIRLAAQLYCEGPTNWKEGDSRPGCGRKGVWGTNRTRVRSHQAARQTTGRRNDNIRDRGVKLCPGKRDNRSLRNCPPKSPLSSSSSNSSSSRFHNSSETSELVGRVPQ